MIEIFVIKYNYIADIQEWYYYESKTEYFEDEIEYKVRLTQLQDDYQVNNIIIYSGSIMRIGELK